MSLVVTAAPLTPEAEDAEHPGDPDYPGDSWLADGTFYDVDQLQGGDDLLITDLNSELCPRVPNELPVESCDVTQCISDDECSGRQLKCCYNGCVYTCLAEVHRPVQIDWLQEPQKRLQYGSSWTIPDQNGNIDVELCSTTPVEDDDDDDDDADPLICPHGYECSIDDPGKPEAGIPNRGRCVKVIDVRKVTEKLEPKPSLSMEETLQADAPYSYTPKNCPLGYDSLVLLEGHSITQNGRECLCEAAELKCDVKAKPKPAS